MTNVAADTPLYVWDDEFDGNDEETRKVFDQAADLTKLPFVYNRICLMPDWQLGMGMPVGGIIACENAIIPNN